MKRIVFGIGLIISGSLGVALGNLEETLFYSAPRTDIYVQSASYYLFCIFIVLGIISAILGFVEKKKD